jgi:hypothetical protein
MQTLTVEGEALRVPLRGEMVAFGSEGSLVRACVQGQGVEQRPLPDARRGFLPAPGPKKDGGDWRW